MKSTNEIMGGNLSVMAKIKGEDVKLDSVNGWYPRFRLFLTPGGKLGCGLYSEMNVVEFIRSLDYEERYAAVYDEAKDLGKAIVIVNFPLYFTYRMGKMIRYIRGENINRSGRALGGNPAINYELVEELTKTRQGVQRHK